MKAGFTKLLLGACLCAASPALAQQQTGAKPNTFSEGVKAAEAAVQAQPTRPLPATLSDEAKAAIAAQAKLDKPSPLADDKTQRAFIDKYQDDFGAIQRRYYAVDLSEATMAGVPVRWIKAKDQPKTNLVLMNMHGGGFKVDSGSQTENIPIAALTKIPVVAVRYRLAPEHSWKDALDDGMAVYRELLKTHKPSEIGLYGTSAGAILGPQLIARIKKEGLPEPAVFGMFSGDADLSKKGDTMSLLPIDITPLYQMYLGKTPATDPSASVTMAPADFFPPTLCLSSSRDFYLSSTSNFCRHLEKSGVEAQLVVFDGLDHAFWSYLDTPESRQAFEVMARFLSRHLKSSRRH